MRQYMDVKTQYSDAIVLFRMGDFYETFDRDAELVANDLEITLTSRNMGKNLRVPMAGVPAHSLDNYLGRLITKGHKTVQIADELNVSVHTINSHRKNILKKLNLKSPTELIVYAMETGLVRA